MAGLAAGEVYRRIKPVDLAPVLRVIHTFGFISVGNSSPQKYACDVMLQAHFPPQIAALIDSLKLGGMLARAVVRKLSARQNIPPHVDKWMPAEADWRRFQVPLVSHSDIVMRWPNDGVETHLEPGFLYEVRFDRLHEVVHGADCDRIHLQIDQVAATI